MQGIINNKIDIMNCTINMSQNNNYSHLQREVIDLQMFSVQKWEYIW